MFKLSLDKDLFPHYSIDIINLLVKHRKVVCIRVPGIALYSFNHFSSSVKIILLQF